MIAIDLVADRQQIMLESDKKQVARVFPKFLSNSRRIFRVRLRFDISSLHISGCQSLPSASQRHQGNYIMCNNVHLQMLQTFSNMPIDSASFYKLPTFP